MNDNDIWDVLSQDSTPIFKFAVAGDGILGAIAEEPVLIPLTEFESKEQKVDAKGRPAMQILLVLQTTYNTADSPDGLWRVYIDKPRQRAARTRTPGGPAPPARPPGHPARPAPDAAGTRSAPHGADCFWPAPGGAEILKLR